MTDVIDQSAGFLESVNQLLGCVLHWTDEDPYAVRMMLINVFDRECESVTWEFGRDLIDEAFNRPDHVVGIGDVLVMHDTTNGDFRLWLSDINNDRHSILLDPQRVLNFSLRTYMVTPSGEEQTAVDRALQELLGPA